MKKSWVALVGIVVVGLAVSCNHGRSDAQVTGYVQKEIGMDPGIPANTVAVQTSNGVVTLSGTVSNEQVRIAAANDASRTEGVKSVVNNLQVEAPSVAAAPAPVETPQAAPTRDKPVAAKLAKVKPAKLPVGQSADNQNAPAKPSDDEIYKDLSSSEAAPANATPAPAPAPVATPAPPAKVTIPTGTKLSIRLADGLDSEKNQVGDTFKATLNSPIVIDDQTVLPKNADIEGRVVDVKSAGKFAGGSNLTLELTSLTVNGKTYNLQSDQWSKSGTGEGKKTAAKAGGGALLGAIIGGIAGGGRGAAIGTVAGAGAGTGAAAATNKANQIKLEPEALLNFSLESSLTVTPQATENRDAGRAQLNQ